MVFMADAFKNEFMDTETGKKNPSKLSLLFWHKIRPTKKSKNFSWLSQIFFILVSRNFQFFMTLNNLEVCRVKFLWMANYASVDLLRKLVCKHEEHNEEIVMHYSLLNPLVQLPNL
jgi:hypothetical protein